MLNATYKKGRKDGEWILRVEGTPRPGSLVKVTTKAGDKKLELVGHVLWRGDGISLCSIQREASDKCRPGMDCPRCGSEPLDDDLGCWECGFSGK